MKTIKVFLASSEELRTERLEFADLVLQLNKLFKIRGLEIELEKWEHLDASMSAKHKQEEYNDILRECELCLTLYWTKFGDYTTEELETAYEELKAGRNPRKLYVFFKDAENVTPELQAFKDSFATKYGHFFCKFENVDTMRLQFLLQLEAYQNNSADKFLKVENQQVLVEGQPVVDLNNVPFAAMNKEFVRLRDGIAACENDIAQFRAILSQMDNPAIDAMLNAKITERNKLQEEFDTIQNALLNTAIRVAQLKGAEYDDLLQRAIEAFEVGNLERTHTLLQEASLKVAQEREAYKLKKESLESDRSNLIKRIKQLLLDAEAVIGVEAYSIEERIDKADKADKAYNEALLTAREVDYDIEELASLIFDYAQFTEKYAKYNTARELYLEHITLCEKLHGAESTQLATSYNNIGAVYNNQGDYPKALEYYFMALEIYEKVLSKEHPSTATSYNNIGLVYKNQGDYPKALEYYLLNSTCKCN
ncbi:MAG: tetratricopeptide repeat protein [Rikenellaceae bacterium]